MEPVNLSILVVNCKQYIPSYNWYFCKSRRYFCGTANSPDDICFNEARLKEFNDSDDYVLMPECPGMTDDEAAVVLKWWCRQNDIPCYVIIILVQKLWNKNVHLVSLTSSERRHVNDHQLANCYKS